MTASGGTRSVDSFHLTGEEIQGAARALVGGQLEVLPANKDTIAKLEPDALRSLVDLRADNQTNHGGVGRG
jgi:hypothetical protein